MPFPVMLMAAVMAQRRTQVRERLWQLDAMRTRCHHKGKVRQVLDRRVHKVVIQVIKVMIMLFPLRRGSLPSSFSPLLAPFVLSSSLPANPHGAQPGTRIAGPKRESAGSRGPLPKSCSPVWALDTLSPSPSILPLLIPGRGNAGPSASGGCTPKRYWPCICPRCALITSQGFFGCAREKLPIARLWADANSPGQLHPKAGRGWRQVTFAPRRFRKKIQGKLRKSQVPLSYNIITAICYPLHIA